MSCVYRLEVNGMLRDQSGVLCGTRTVMCVTGAEETYDRRMWCTGSVTHSVNEV